VEELLAAGITVLSTVNVQHLESLNDVVEQITGVVQQETVPDEVVRAAAQVELVDITPEALRRRLAHGNVYAAEKVDAAMSNYFRPGNLTALRELALLWLADQVDAALAKYRADKDITATVVSMPCVEWFESQPAEYRDKVLPPAVSARVAVEAAVAQSWYKLVGDTGEIVSIEHYGESADDKTLFREFGFTPEAVVAAAERSLDN